MAEPKTKFKPKSTDDLSAPLMDRRIAHVEIPVQILKLALRLKIRYDLTMSYLLAR